MRLRLLTFCLLLMRCASTTPIEPGEPFTLRVGEAVRVDACDLSIHLVDVRDDSRCPAGVTCVWAGDAEIEIELVRHGRTETIHRRLVDEPGNGPCSVRVTELGPEARQGTTIERSEYEVTMVVSAP